MLEERKCCADSNSENFAIHGRLSSRGRGKLSPRVEFWQPPVETSVKMNPLPPFYFAQRAPDRQLAPWFAKYWTYLVCEGAPALYALPPDGSTSILIRLGGHQRTALHVTGPWPEPRTIAVVPGERYFGIRLQPGATWEVLGVEAADLRSRTIPCDRYLGAFSHRIARELVECEDLDQAAKVFDRAFLRIADRLELPSTFVGEVVRRMMADEGGVAIALIANTMHTSYSTLLRRFKDATGLAPTEFAKILSYRGAVRRGELAVGPMQPTRRVPSAPALTGEVGLRLMGRREL